MHIPDLYNQFNATPLSILGRYPTIAVKYLFKTASVNKCRFQISFHNQQLYDECVSIFKNYKIPIRQYEDITKLPLSQPISSLEDFKWQQSSQWGQGGAFVCERNFNNSQDCSNSQFLEPKLSSSGSSRIVDPVKPQLAPSSQLVEYSQLSNNNNSIISNSVGAILEEQSDEELRKKIIEKLSDEHFLILLRRIERLTG